MPHTRKPVQTYIMHMAIFDEYIEVGEMNKMAAIFYFRVRLNRILSVIMFLYSGHISEYSLKYQISVVLYFRFIVILLDLLIDT